MQLCITRPGLWDPATYKRVCEEPVEDLSKHSLVNPKFCLNTIVRWPCLYDKPSSSSSAPLPPILSQLFMDIAEANPRQLAQTVGILGIGIMSLAVF
jgi:hypothetical protein